MMQVFNHPLFRTLALLMLGGCTVLSFAPFYVYPVSLITIALFCLYLWQSKSMRAAAWCGFLFGLGLYGCGIYWLYICLHVFGNMPAFMAFSATFLLCAFMASFSAGMAAFAYWLTDKSTSKVYGLTLVLSIAASWALFDWVKSWIFTGFPWLSIGYTQVPNGTFAGLLPMIGVYGVSLLTVAYAGLIALFIRDCVIKPAQQRNKQVIVASLILIVTTGWGSRVIDWTHAVGKPFSVDLLQGNIAQDLKWSPAMAASTIARYEQMVVNSDAALIILPETALPILSTQWSQDLRATYLAHTQANHSNVIVGIVEYAPEEKTYFNSALSIGVDKPQYYQKSHLVPFGEFIPFKQLLEWIYRDYLNMPMSDMSRGSTLATPMQLNEQKVAINICYEDVFGEEVIRQLPEATILANLTNDAWYGDSIAADQHLQFSQARALETGRMVLRATNTGATAVIDPKGRVIAHAPHFKQTVLSAQAQGYAGTTPYVRFGNWPFLIICLSAIIWLLRHLKKE